ncbi:MAG: FKBP-type peptidyl-prolyl cis-trans isomerase [Planctomycetaceae bacterium]|nr:FKBP-type peptidyl-prolyl cis-trans isomerase [Planctomycetaceae bacterium]
MGRNHLPSGLKIRLLAEGKGMQAERGMQVAIHFRCFLNRGDEIENTYDRNEPYCFQIGKRQAIAGVEYGVEGMRVGEKRELIVSPHLAYGDQSVNRIPSNAVLRFEIELLDVRTLQD